MRDAATRGLSAAEVAERRRRGLVNRAPGSGWSPYARIVSRNLFTLFNLMVAPAAAALFALGEYRGGIAASGMAVINTVVGLVQEVYAKRQLDRLAILVETRARVVRDGEVQTVPSGEVVQGDHVLLTAGEVVIADGPVLEARFLEVDEALLTGESDPVRRQPGDTLLSGSFAIAGEGRYRADRVGAEAFAHELAAQARHYREITSPLTRVINLLIHVLSYTAVALCGLYAALYFLRGFPQTELVQMVAATITSMVPQGLVLTATLSFSLGAVRMSQRGAVVQRLSAVETMAAVDVVCTDKTGTLTTNHLRLDRVCVLAAGPPEDEVRRRLALFASASVDRANKSIEALRVALGERPAELLDQLPFKAQNRYSAVRVRDRGVECVLVLGAAEALKEFVAPGTDGAWESTCKGLLPTGLRLLLFAEAPPGPPFGPTLEGYALRPLALVGLSDQLRPGAGAVLEKLAGQGVAFKILSGDNPVTVRATVGGLNLPLAHEPVLAGDRLGPEPDWGELARTHSVFGRVSPSQKVALVEGLQGQGRHVAMIGDGVNDVLPLKRADLGVAMGAGSHAARTVAGLVLAENDFALLPETLEEGRTIVRNLRRSGKLFLVKNVYSLILILAGSLGWFGLPFPYLPQQVTLLNWLIIGIPAFAIALGHERSAAATRPAFLREVGWFAVRTGLVFALAGLVVLLVSVRARHDGVEAQRTLLLSTLILLGVTALFRVLTDGESRPLVGDTRFRLLAVAAIPAYLAVMHWPFAADFFRIRPLTAAQWLLVVGVVLPAYGLSLLTDRIRL